MGRHRLLAAAGAVVTLVGCVLPWWTVGGGTNQLSQLTGNAFDSSGILVFVAALATIALVTLPYARERPVRADRWSSYAVIAGVAWLGFLYRVLDLLLAHALQFDAALDVVTRIPGLWVTAVGLVLLARAAYDMRSLPSEW
ncbi:MAG TPA: hypothetical protein VGI98_08475 [Candidatus Limnocylindrales bacterium]